MNIDTALVMLTRLKRDVDCKKGNYGKVRHLSIKTQVKEI